MTLPARTARAASQVFGQRDVLAGNAGLVDVGRDCAAVCAWARDGKRVAPAVRAASLRKSLRAVAGCGWWGGIGISLVELRSGKIVGNSESFRIQKVGDYSREAD